MLTDNYLFYSLFYILLSLCVIYPPNEFVSAGVTIKMIFSSLLGSENEKFILYHIKRSALTLLVYSLLPLGYLICLSFVSYSEEVLFLWSYDNFYLWGCFNAVCLILPLLALYQIKKWSSNNWESHPIAVNISKFSNNSSWISVASDINTEYRRPHKICIQINAVSRVVVTENWIMKITPLKIFFAHQNDSSLEINHSDAHDLSPDNRGQVQYVNIKIKPTRENGEPFTIRLNTLDFQDFQDYVVGPIVVLPNITFHKNLIEKFVETFKAYVTNNPRYTTSQELESCVGCMQNIANVKLQKLCPQGPDDESCVTCNCRPMWCVSCMARWFASRQNSEQPETWLSSKCTCPMCRAKFCILDVCLLDDQ